MLASEPSDSLDSDQMTEEVGYFGTPGTHEEEKYMADADVFAGIAFDAS